MSTATKRAAPPMSPDTTRLVPISELHTHPAQMRTVYDPAAMATLTVQVLQAGGIAEWDPIVATPHPNTDGYSIISGHRRRMALLFSWALVEAYPAMQQTLTVEQVDAFLNTLLAKHATIEAAADALLATYSERTVRVHMFKGDAKEQALAVQRAN